ncbi:MAG: gamma-glutamyl-gamma-aminobutyrate hydrolase family protein [Deltaproteobacteria bacterium]|nr:gamma-glutamyl-gamma-aminobutyrate hydrolase family protein [Deltaproteobacteria bacterium]MDZ4342234.1 gamma-glutamyl-gamma-aminobutyrate hydrolase family protein [Candidatus Binatia bacterium]
MKKLLVLQHVAHELLGTLNPLLKRNGFRIRYVNLARHPEAQPSLDGYHGLVVLGGPMSVNDTRQHPRLMTELHLIEGAMRRNLPVLGICLGAQLIARTLGAPVYPNGEKEIGWYDVTPTKDAEEDPLLAEFQGTEKIFQWHGETFDLPKTSAHLAFSSLCANQAFRFGRNIYGLQFHLEVDEPMIERWLRVVENRWEITSLGGKIDPAAIRRDTPLHLAHLQQLGNQVFGEFIRLFS